MLQEIEKKIGEFSQLIIRGVEGQYRAVLVLGTSHIEGIGKTEEELLQSLLVNFEIKAEEEILRHQSHIERLQESKKKLSEGNKPK